MQPNLQQDVKFNYAAKAEVMQKYLTLSDRASGPQSTGVRDAQHPDLAGIGVSVLPDPRSRRDGADRRSPAQGHRADHRARCARPICRPASASRAPIIRSMSSTMTAACCQVYDKLHLVPFGEYLPFQELMEKLGFVQLTQRPGRIHSGHARAAPWTYRTRRGALPLICYEAIFPGDVAAPRRSPGLDHQPDQ